MADTTNDYVTAWAEGEEAGPAESAVAAAKKAVSGEREEYITAYADLDSGQSVNGEDLKDVRPNDPAQEKGTIATNKSEPKKEAK